MMTFDLLVLACFIYPLIQYLEQGVFTSRKSLGFDTVAHFVLKASPSRPGEEKFWASGSPGSARVRRPPWLTRRPPFSSRRPRIA